MLGKILRHAKDGTLLDAIKRKFGMARPAQPDPDHYHGETALNYLQKRLKQEMWHREQDVVKEMLSAYPNGVSVLDVPFGTGRFVDMYLEKDMAVYGIDISEDMLAAARDELGASFARCKVELGSADSLPYADASFDLVVCVRFLGLIPLAMARRVLSELNRVCRGSIIIRVPVRKAEAGALPTPKEDELVQGQFLERELKSLFAQYGFAVSQRRVVGERESVEYVVYVLNRGEAVDLQNSAT
jgi:ubiquinone/menaquinone biosynthesis C-methylase UbiE